MEIRLIFMKKYTFLIIVLSLVSGFGCSSGSDTIGIATPSTTDASSVTVSAVSPSSGSTLGGETLTITGSKFISGITISVGSANCSSVTLISSTQLTCIAPSGSAGAASIEISSGGLTATLPNGYTYVTPSVIVPIVFDIYFGSQTGSTSLILKLRYNSSSNAISLTTTNDVTSTLGTDGIRYLIDLSSGGLLVGGSNTSSSIWSAILSPFALGTAQTLSGRPTTELSDYIGGCALPNGNIIAGSYGNGLKSEFSSSRTYLRDLPPFTFYLSDCVATASSTTLYVSDYDANSDSAGLVRKFSYSGSAWSQASSLNVTTFGGATSGSTYSLVLNSNGHLYIPPQAPGAGSVSKLIKCQNGDLSNCSAIGANWPVSYPGGAVEGAVQIPGTNDMLFIDNTNIYRYKVSDDTMTVIYTLAVPGHQWTRHMRIRAVP